MAEVDLHTITSILKQLDLFKELNEEDHKEIIKRITMEYYPANHVIFRENDPGNSMYIIKNGIVRIFHENKDPAPQSPSTLLDISQAGQRAQATTSEAGEKEVSMLGDGDFFGEMALLSEKPRNATAMTTEETQVFKLNKDDFIQLVSQNPGMASRISNEFLKRLKINLRENT